MMLKPYAFANAFTLVSLAIYMVCRILSLLAPEFLFNISASWFHTFSLASLKGTIPFDLGMFIFGAVTLSVLVWVTVYAGALLYNRWAR